MCFRLPIAHFSPLAPALLGPRSGRGRVFVLIGPVGVGRRWTHFWMHKTRYQPQLRPVGVVYLCYSLPSKHIMPNL